MSYICTVIRIVFKQQLVMIFFCYKKIINLILTMGTLPNKKTKKKQPQDKTKKVIHTYRVLTQKEIEADRSSAYTFIL